MERIRKGSTMKVIINGIDITQYGVSVDDYDGEFYLNVTPILKSAVPWAKATASEIDDTIQITIDFKALEAATKKNNNFLRSLKFKGKTQGKNIDGEVTLETQVGNVSYDTKTQAVGFEGEIKL